MAAFLAAKKPVAVAAAAAAAVVVVVVVGGGGGGGGGGDRSDRGRIERPRPMHVMVLTRDIRSSYHSTRRWFVALAARPYLQDAVHAPRGNSSLVWLKGHSSNKMLHTPSRQK